MSPTRAEQKAALEYMAKIAKRGQIIWSSDPGAMTTDAAATILRAMLETFDEREDFYEAAKRYFWHCVDADDSGEPRKDHEPPEDDAIDAYRALVAKEGKK